MGYFSDLAIGKPMPGDKVKHKNTKQTGIVDSVYGTTNENCTSLVIFDDGTVCEDLWNRWDILENGEWYS